MPNGWERSRLTAIVAKEIKRGKAPQYIEKSNTIVFAQKCNLKSGEINLNLAKYLDENVLSKYSETDFLKHGDVVINSTGTGTLGRVGIIKNIDNLSIVPDSHITTIRGFDGIIPEYLYTFLKSHQSYLEKSGEGTTNQKELKPNTLRTLILPVPPYQEQIRISKEISNIYNILKEIEDNLI